MVQTLFCLCLEHLALVPVAVFSKHLWKRWQQLFFIFEQIKEKQHILSKIFMEKTFI